MKFISALAASVLGTTALAEANSDSKFNLRSRVALVVTPSPTPFPSSPPTVTQSPTVVPCEGSTPGWGDVDGDGCQWYEQFDEPGCPIAGAEYEGTMGVADDNCCYCFGTAAPAVTPPTTPWPTGPPVTQYPTVTQFPTVVPCEGSTPGWADSSGDGCRWYERFDAPGCPNFGDSYEGPMGVANDNCCYCFGTAAPVVTPSPTPWPSSPPTVTQSPTVVPCEGSASGWTDGSGDGCEWYAQVDEPGCPNFGDSYEGPMGVADDNCCYCFGTAAPVVTPTQSS